MTVSGAAQRCAAPETRQITGSTLTMRGNGERHRREWFRHRQMADGAHSRQKEEQETR
jgi:hypothetical protein